MFEVEVKAKIIDFNSIIDKLASLDCTLSCPLVQKDRIFLHSSLKFEDIKRGDSVIRIRDSNGEITLNLKKQLSNELANFEEQTIISDIDSMVQVLQALGFVQVLSLEKTRRKTKYKDLEICLDRVEGLGDFIEVEKLCKDGDSDKIQDELFKFLESLGVKKSDRVFKGYDSLIFEKNKQ